jgi:carbonic anhydrase
MKRLLTFLAFTALFIPLSGAQSASPAQGHDTHAVAQGQPVPSADQIWSNLVAGNKRFVAGKMQTHAVVALRRKLASVQTPHVIVLACSDSRVSPELIFDQSLGDLFVVRTAGNVADPVALGSIEYAVDHLHSTVLVVLGHTKCGAVTAACSGEKMPSRNLDAIVDKITPAVNQAKTYAKADALVEAAIKENVQQSGKDLLANSAILSEAVTSGKLTLLEAEYQLDTGEVVRLNPSPKEQH